MTLLVARCPLKSEEFSRAQLSVEQVPSKVSELNLKNVKNENIFEYVSVSKQLKCDKSGEIEKLKNLFPFFSRSAPLKCLALHNFYVSFDAECL